MQNPVSSGKDGKPNSGRERRRRAGSAPEWLDLHSLTAYASVCERTLRSWISDQVDPLPASKIRGKILVRRAVFDLWVERHRYARGKRASYAAMTRTIQHSAKNEVGVGAPQMPQPSR
jgi:hypothetical protein